MGENGEGWRDIRDEQEKCWKEKRYERVQSPFTATVELRNDFVILSCFWMKTLSPLVRPDRP
jgi:hypothetical protein